MPKRSLADRLEEALQLMLSQPETTLPPIEPGLAPLLQIAQELRTIPREDFRARLKADLERRSQMATSAQRMSAVQQTAVPQMRVRNAAAAIEFYKKAFGAIETMRFVGPDERIGHAELKIGNSFIMLSDEALDYGFAGPQELGGSPVGIHLYVDDADTMAAQAVAAGARLVTPVKDQFYGDRSGTVEDPFGYSWTIATRVRDMSLAEMHQQFDALIAEGEGRKAPADTAPQTLHSITPYLVAENAPALMEFIKQAFGAEETVRSIGSAGGVHGELRISDSTLMVGGGSPELAWRGEPRPAALHMYVEDVDAVYERALAAGGTSIDAPADQEYGERSASVKDQSGNDWYIATSLGESFKPAGLYTVTPCLHPLRSEPLISFLKRAFGAVELEKYASPEGVVHHAKLRIGDSTLEMGDAHGKYQPMATMFYLSVPNVDATYRRALKAGASSIGEPSDQSYGARTAGVRDTFGNEWYLATPIAKG
jgi:PhnB protein